MNAVTGRMLLGVAALLLVLTYLLLHGAAPDTALHARRLDALDALALNQAALHRDVLKARAGMLRNYDPLVSAVDGLRDAAGRLEEAGATNPEFDPHFAALEAELREQEALVEDFKSRNALLQNSLAYFAHVSHRLGILAGERQGVMAAAAANAMFRFMGDPSGPAATDLADALNRLASLPASAPRRADAHALVAHGRLILATLPALDDVLARLFATRATEQADLLQHLLLDDYRRAEIRAESVRILLYAASVLLLAYLCYLYRRLRTSMGALAERSRALKARSDFERLIASISAEFINLPRDRIGDGIDRGLERLGRHAQVDRAYVVASGDDGRGVENAHAWLREGAAADGWPDDAPAVAGGWSLKGQERHGCIYAPSVAALPPGSEKEALAERGIRSWFCVPLWRGGRRIGVLGLDAMRDEKRWPDDDIALLRMAGEIFANALERARAEGEKDALETRLRQAQRMEAIGTLAGGIAHDFNNILGAVLGYAEMALAGLPKGSRPWQHVREVRIAGERARDVVDQILAFSRGVERKRRPVRMRPLIEETIGLLRASFPATVALRVNIRAEDVVVHGDPSQLQQVVVNLCTNAAQAMAGHGTAEIDLDAVASTGDQVLSHGTLAAGRYVRLSVTDTGRGMDEGVLERIFEPFFTTKAAGTGTGLGLATVHGIVADHGGALNVRSRPGEGSTFEAYFVRTDALPESEEPVDAPRPVGRGEVILLVDDERPLVLLGEEMLSALGYEPVGYDSSTRALEAFRADPHRFDLVLADQIMPDMTGVQLAAAVHRIRPDLPIVLMSGYSGPVGSDQLRAAGIREVLRKPLRSSDILESLGRHLHPGFEPGRHRLRS